MNFTFPQQSHHLIERELPTWWRRGGDSRAIWSLNPSGHLIVFVHGFTGHAVRTWARFNTELRTHYEFAGSDLVFFGYDGVKARASVSADYLLEFLDFLHQSPSSVRDASLGREQRLERFSFSRTTIVAHSLGAVVSRMALVTATEKKLTWVNNTQLALFAPAHCGAEVFALARTLLIDYCNLGAALAVASGVAPVLLDLDEESRTLKDLQRDTETALRNGARHLAARAIARCAYDGVVHPNRFCVQDAQPDTLERTHSNICKPDAHYEEPVRTLRKLF